MAVSFGPVKPLGPDFSAEVDTVSRNQWSAAVQEFGDANIFQTWSYGAARSGDSHLSHLVLKRAGRVVGAAQARLAGLPRLRLGAAYIHWGPLWKLRGAEADPEIFRQAVRAIRNEYTIRRGQVVRLVPALSTEENVSYSRILEEEGFQLKRGDRRYRTILMDLRPPLDELERGFHQKWRKHLNRARKNNLEMIEGEEDGLLESLGALYKEMVQRKQFAAPAEITPYRQAQKALAPCEKMTVILCKADGDIVAGALFSTLGDTALDLFRATSNRGLNCYGSYLIQWRALECFKRRGCQRYNLNGINPAVNPGGYQFKSQLAGRNGSEVDFLGTFDTYPNEVMKVLATVGERIRACLKRRRRAAGRAAVEVETEHGQRKSQLGEG